MRDPDKTHIRSVISRSGRGIFALTLYLLGDKDKAYNAAAMAFAGVMRGVSGLEKEETVVDSVIRAVVEKGRQTKIIAASVSLDQDFAVLPPFERESLKTVNIALQRLPYEQKALILLRDQLHLPYRRIAGILNLALGATKIKANEARIELRDTIKNILDHGR